MRRENVFTRRPKICVPITSLVGFGIFNEAKRIAGLDVEMAEWRIDFFAGKQEEINNIVVELKKILGDKELICSLRTVNEGGEDNGERFEYFSVINDIIEQDVADYVDIELSADESSVEECIKNAREKNIRLIGSFHDFEKTPGEIEILNYFVKVRNMGFDMAKAACMPKSKSDVDAMFAASDSFCRSNPDFPVVSISMGKIGAATRIYGGLFGSCITFASLANTSAPGQRNVDDILKTFGKLYARPNHIILIGFMGTGKSTLSHEISDEYDMPEIDTDALIEKRCSKSIKQIFAEDGEDIFRMIETDILDELGTWERSVVSCGGGTVLADINLRKLRVLGTIVLLTATPETVFKRLRGSDERPLLRGRMNVAYISELMGKRRAVYEASADVVVATDGRDIHDIAKEVLAKCRNV